MADPVITIHDGTGTEITAGTPVPLPTATPGTPTSPDVVISVRNNDAGGPAVDPARDFRLSLTGRLAGSSDEPTADELAYLVTRSLQAQVTAVSGGATADIRSYQPVGTGRPLRLGEIPDGGITTLGFRVVAPLAATIQDVEIFLSWESIQSTALEEGSFESHGNYIYNGNSFGVPDRLFTQILSISGALDVGVFDDTIDTWTEIQYTLEGTAFTTTPTVPTLTFDDLDGAAAALAAGQAYIAGVFLDGSPTDFLISKGLLGTAPLQESDRPATPDNTEPAGYVTVPFGLAIDNAIDVLSLGFFGLEPVAGLIQFIGSGRAAVSGRWIDSQSPTQVTFPDDSDLEIYVQPEAGLEIVIPPVTPIDPHSMRIWEATTLAGAVTSITSRRRIGVRTVAGLLAAATFVVDAAAADLQVVHVSLRDGIGIPVEENLEIGYFVSGDPDGIGISADALTDLTVGASPQSVRFLTDNLTGVFGTSLLGTVDATFDESTGPSGNTFFLVIQIGAVKFVSGAITPKP